MSELLGDQLENGSGLPKTLPDGTAAAGLGDDSEDVAAAMVGPPI